MSETKKHLKPLFEYISDAVVNGELPRDFSLPQDLCHDDADDITGAPHMAAGVAVPVFYEVSHAQHHLALYLLDVSGFFLHFLIEAAVEVRQDIKVALVLRAIVDLYEIALLAAGLAKPPGRNPGDAGHFPQLVLGSQGKALFIGVQELQDFPGYPIIIWEPVIHFQGLQEWQEICYMPPIIMYAPLTIPL